MGVAQVDTFAASASIPSVKPKPLPFRHFFFTRSRRSHIFCGSPPSKFCAVGVGHGDPVEAAADVRRVDGASRDIDAPAGVTFSRQVSSHSVEPTVARRSRNLLSHDESGPTGTDEPKQVGPQMPWVVGAKALAGDRKRLARARAGPERSIVGPPSKSSCM
jgi:hypothetical protein